MNVTPRTDVDHAEPRVVALAHPSLDRLVARFAMQLDGERSGDALLDGRTAIASSDLLEPRTLRLGLVIGERLVSIVSVTPDGHAAIVTLEPWRGSGVDRQLLAVAIERSLAVGDTIPVFRSDRLDASLVSLALACGAEVTGRTPVQRLVPV